MPDTIRRNEHTKIIKDGRKEKKKKGRREIKQENARGVSLGRDICYFIKKDAEITSPYICLTIVSPCII